MKVDDHHLFTNQNLGLDENLSEEVQILLIESHFTELPNMKEEEETIITN